MQTIQNASIALFGILISFNVSFAQCCVHEDTSRVVLVPPPQPPADEIFDVVEVEASFPGGVEFLQQFIKENVTYPEEAIQKKEHGRVYVRFVVEKEGSITNIVIARGVSRSLDAEAIRLVKMMPNWSPGMQRGKAVRTRVVVPILFKL
jgi:TonB family protein